MPSLTGRQKLHRRLCAGWHGGRDAEARIVSDLGQWQQRACWKTGWFSYSSNSSRWPGSLTKQQVTFGWIWGCTSSRRVVTHGVTYSGSSGGSDCGTGSLRLDHCSSEQALWFRAALIFTLPCMCWLAVNCSRSRPFLWEAGVVRTLGRGHTAGP